MQTKLDETLDDILKKIQDYLVNIDRMDDILKLANVYRTIADTRIP